VQCLPLPSFPLQLISATSTATYSSQTTDSEAWKWSTATSSSRHAPESDWKFCSLSIKLILMPIFSDILLDFGTKIQQKL
jgi:hypothetical protein